MKTAVVIFSRLDSRRLPGKALRNVNGRPLLGHVIDRCRAAEKPNAVIVATSDRSTDDEIAVFAETAGAQVFRGSAHDVLGRAAACMAAHDLDAMVRICGDSPFIDPSLIDDFIGRHQAERPDVTCNLLPRTFPPGMSFEVVSRAAMDRTHQSAASPHDREHVTTYIYSQSGEYRIVNIESGIDDHWATPLTVDTPEDLVQAHWLARRLADDGADYSMQHVLALARQWRHMRPAERKVSA